MHHILMKQSLPSQTDLTWWEWEVYKCMLAQKGHRAGCLSWPYRRRLRTQITQILASPAEEEAQISSGCAAQRLTLLFCFRRHGHVVELVDQPYTVGGGGGRRQWWRLSKHISAAWQPIKNVTYKLSIMGVEVHGLCVSLCRGMDFIRWYMGGHAIRACRV